MCIIQNVDYKSYSIYLRLILLNENIDTLIRDSTRRK